MKRRDERGRTRMPGVSDPKESAGVTEVVDIWGEGCRGRR
jgi:hypothetical protein